MRITLTVALGALSACSLPPFEYEGEHVVVTSNHKVCAGTLESLDRAIEHIDLRLGFDTTDEPLRIAILDEAESQRLNLCDTCMTHRNGVLVVLNPYDVEKDGVHEMVHARMSRIEGNSVPLFSEGVAVAVAPALCLPKGTPPALDTLLAVQTAWDLDRHGYYAGGELIAWLFETHGPTKTLGFLGTLKRPEAATRASDRHFVGESYRAHFGTELDDDIFAHTRSPDQLTPEELGCVAPGVLWHGDRIHLQAALDCDSRRVESDFRYPNRGFVNWTVEIPETSIPRRYRLLDTLPKETEMKIAPCVCNLNVAREQFVWNQDTKIGANIELEPGVYVVRWQGPLDRGLELDIELEAYHGE